VKVSLPSRIPSAIQQDANANYNRGNALYGEGDLEGAIREFREALRSKPEDPEVHYNLGLALYEKRDLDGAAVEYRAALNAKPDYAEAHNNLGMVLVANSPW
jgi:Flp pilus assembly protein TadD